PSGLTATAISGTGWACTLATLTCTRSDALAAGAAYPSITLTVNVAANAPSSVTNVATVSGGSELNTANNTASNPRTSVPARAVQVVLTSGTTWTVPADWTNSNNTVESYGAGGGGGGVGGFNGNSYAGGGGGGAGAYSKISNFSSTPGTSINIRVGAGGAGGTPDNWFGTHVGGTGGDTWFNGTTLGGSSGGAKGGGGGEGGVSGSFVAGRSR